MKVTKNDLDIVVSSVSGLPEAIFLRNKAVMRAEQSLFSVRLGNGRIARPCCSAAGEPFVSTTEQSSKIVFHKLLWQDDRGNTLDDFYLSLTYEIWSDGAVFVDTFFFVENTAAPDLADFILEIPLTFAKSDNPRWGFIPRPAVSDGTMIQSSSPGRFLVPGANVGFPGEIVPQFSFDGRDEEGVGCHCEFFVEGHASLSGKREDVSTEIDWESDTPAILWNFQTRKATCRERPWQWRNRWGFLMTSAPVRRKAPPLRIYHYFDNYERYPSGEQLDRVSAAGADVLMLHENWRLDAQNGGIPYDHHKFRQVVEQAHDSGMRVAVYIRGNENSVYADACGWFDDLLEKNRDGLYMDYGGPMHEVVPPDETYPGGRVDFRKHHQKVRGLRDRVGEGGLLFSHTGPVFSALGMTDGTVDGYVSGEGERGIMIMDRRSHEYYSMAYAVTGTMWTAAFPEYGTAKMIPFLAAAGQSPHTPLGIQFANSSLSHPRWPGINDVHLRPLWKLWELFKSERDISIYNDYNCKDVFSGDKSDETGRYLMVSRDGKYALLIVSNFAKEKSLLKVGVNWGNTGFLVNGQTDCVLLRPDINLPGEPVKYEPVSGTLCCEIEANGVAAWLFSSDTARINQMLDDFRKPCIGKDSKGIAHADYVAKQRDLRQNPPSYPEIYLKVYVENLAVPYEESMWWDLFDNALQFGILDGNRKFESMGWISLEGLVNEKPGKEKYIWPGHESPWINLTGILPPGKHTLAIRSIHGGEPFYSFVKARLSPEPTHDDPNSYLIEFLNDIEPDRSFLVFCCNI